MCDMITFSQKYLIQLESLAKGRHGSLCINFFKSIKDEALLEDFAANCDLLVQLEYLTTDKERADLLVEASKDRKINLEILKQTLERVKETEITIPKGELSDILCEVLKVSNTDQYIKIMTVYKKIQDEYQEKCDYITKQKAKEDQLPLRKIIKTYRTFSKSHKLSISKDISIVNELLTLSIDLDILSVHNVVVQEYIKYINVFKDIINCQNKGILDIEVINNIHDIDIAVSSMVATIYKASKDTYISMGNILAQKEDYPNIAFIITRVKIR